MYQKTPKFGTNALHGRSCRSRGLSARTSSLALKAHRAFNLKQAQRSKLPSRATL
ncbi:hypothetical protein CJI53_02280 [Bifidobacteriaceae bacterium VN002]|nr:hypothetical protein CJI53_02280 [Bifidobacteriaceae bacterium VN002]